MGRICRYAREAGESPDAIRAELARCLPDIDCSEEHDVLRDMLDWLGTAVALIGIGVTVQTALLVLLERLARLRRRGRVKELERLSDYRRRVAEIGFRMRATEARAKALVIPE